MDGVEPRLDAIEARLGRIENDLRTFRAELPRMIAGTMREVLARRRSGPV